MNGANFLSSILSAVKNVIDTLKMVSTKASEEDVKTVVYTILKISQRSRYSETVDGHAVSEYKTDPSFVSLATPREVTVDTDQLAPNLKVGFEELNDFKANPAEYMAAQAQVLALFKKTADFGVDLTTATVQSTLSQVAEQVTNGVAVPYKASFKLPVLVKDADVIFGAARFNLPLDEAISLWATVTLAESLRNKAQAAKPKSEAHVDAEVKA